MAVHSLLLLLFALNGALTLIVPTVPLGVFLSSDVCKKQLLDLTVHFAIEKLNDDPSARIAPDEILGLCPENSTNQDAWDIAENVCNHLDKGLAALLADHKSHLYGSISRNVQVPFINFGPTPTTPSDQRPETKSFHFKVQLLQLPEKEEGFLDFVKKVARESSQQRVILHFTSSKRQKIFLDDLDVFEPRHQFLLCDEFSKSNVDDLAQSKFNMSGFQTIDYESSAVRDFERDYAVHLRNIGINSDNYKGLTIEQAYVYDSIHFAMKSIENVIDEEFIRKNSRAGRLWIDGVKCFDPDPSTFELGPKIRDQIMAGSGSDEQFLTGKIHFSSSGERILSEMILYQLSYNKQSQYLTKKKTVWNNKDGFLYGKSIESFSRAGLGEKQQRIPIFTTVLTSPYTMLKRNADELPPDSNDRFEGYAIDLIKLLAESLGIDHYKIKLSGDGKYGSINLDGSWNGMIGELINEEADMAVAPLSITRARERVVDFSKPFMTTGLTIMVKKPDKPYKQPLFSLLLSPFSSEIWMYLIGAYCIVALCFFLICRFNPAENSQGFCNCLWLALAASIHQNTGVTPKSASMRLLSTLWWFFCLIMILCYTAQLFVLLSGTASAPRLSLPIDSVEDLAKQTSVKYGCQGGGTTAAFFEHSTVQTYQRMWQQMTSSVPSVFAYSYSEGIKRVRESNVIALMCFEVLNSSIITSGSLCYAFILDKTAADYANSRKPCNTMSVGDTLNSYAYGVATAFGSHYKNSVNLAILELQERGELVKLYNKWWYDRGQCEVYYHEEGRVTALPMYGLAGLFLVLAIGLGLAIIIAIIEAACIRCRKNQDPSSEVNGPAQQPLIKEAP